MSSPEISIIIPIYNQSEKISDCLDSIKNQTFKDFEIIIVNDGSDDCDSEKLEKIVKRIFPDAFYFFQENKGAPSARNFGFSKSIGKYVVFCDADCEMKQTMLEELLGALKRNPNASYAYSSFYYGWEKFKLEKFSSERLKKGPMINTISLIKRQSFPGFDENLKRLQDWDLYLTMLELGHTGEFVDKTLFKIKSGGHISSWLPSFVANLGIGRRSREYKKHLSIVSSKHKL